jgi:hypothetical protein
MPKTIAMVTSVAFGQTRAMMPSTMPTTATPTSSPRCTLMKLDGSAGSAFCWFVIAPMLALRAGRRKIMTKG